jgi:hypothetical protein
MGPKSLRQDAKTCNRRHIEGRAPARAAAIKAEDGTISNPSQIGKMNEMNRRLSK